MLRVRPAGPRPSTESHNGMTKLWPTLGEKRSQFEPDDIFFGSQPSTIQKALTQPMFV